MTTVSAPEHGSSASALPLEAVSVGGAVPTVQGSRVRSTGAAGPTGLHPATP